MEDRQLEACFTSIKDDFNHIEDRFKEVDERFDAVDERFDGVDRRFDAVEEKLGRIEDVSRDILELMQNYDRERKEVKSTLWEHDRRLIKLEHSR